MLNILTSENTTYLMDYIPDEMGADDVRYCVLDYSNPDDVDYLWMPMIFLESFTSPSVELKIGNRNIQMPLDWSIVIGEKEMGDIEIISLMSLNDRDFKAFTFNPFSGYMPEYQPIEIVSVYPDVKWYVPKLKFGHVLAVPLSDQKVAPKQDEKGKWLEPGPQVGFFVRDVNKLPDHLDIRNLF